MGWQGGVALPVGVLLFEVVQHGLLLRRCHCLTVFVNVLSSSNAPRCSSAETGNDSRPCVMPSKDEFIMPEKYPYYRALVKIMIIFGARTVALVCSSETFHNLVLVVTISKKICCQAKKVYENLSRYIYLCLVFMSYLAECCIRLQINDLCYI